jgi:type IV secretion system protein VirB1
MIPSLDMLQQYAPDVAPQTIAAIIRVESGGNQFAVGINNCPFARRTHPRSAREAAAKAHYFISKGYSVDLGLMQINSKNLPALGLTVEQALDPAANIQAGARILCRGYRGAVKRFGPGQNALRAALSAYNTGNYEQGFRNGYVAKFFSTAPNCQSARPLLANLSLHHKSGSPVAGRSIIAKGPVSNPYRTDLAVYRGAEVAYPSPAQGTEIAETTVSNFSFADGGQ